MKKDDKTWPADKHPVGASRHMRQVAKGWVVCSHSGRSGAPSRMQSNERWEEKPSWPLSMRFPSRFHPNLLQRPTLTTTHLHSSWSNLDWVDLFRSRHTLVNEMAGSLAVGKLKVWHHTECLEGHDPPSRFPARLKRAMMADKAALRVHNVFGRVMSARDELGHKRRPWPAFWSIKLAKHCQLETKYPQRGLLTEGVCAKRFPAIVILGPGPRGWLRTYWKRNLAAIFVGSWRRRALRRLPWLKSPIR
jgi:hypothetical protein